MCFYENCRVSLALSSLISVFLKFFSCNTYGSPRKCCKQKTYGLAKPFRCNTYKKHGAGVSVMVNQISDEEICPEEHRDEGPLCISDEEICLEEHRDEGPLCISDEGSCPERARRAERPLFTRCERTLRSRWEGCRPRVTTSIGRSRRIGRERDPSRVREHGSRTTLYQSRVTSHPSPRTDNRKISTVDSIHRDPAHQLGRFWILAGKSNPGGACGGAQFSVKSCKRESLPQRKLEVRGIISCEGVFFSENRNFLEKHGVGNKVGLDWQGQKDLECAIEFLPFHAAASDRHQEGVGDLQCPVPRHDRLIPGSKSAKESIDPVNGLVLEAPRQRCGCVQHKAGHQCFRPPLIRSLIFSPPRDMFLRNSLMSAIASEALFMAAPAEPLRREFSVAGDSQARSITPSAAREWPVQSFLRRKFSAC